MVRAVPIPVRGPALAAAAAVAPSLPLAVDAVAAAAAVVAMGRQEGRRSPDWHKIVFIIRGPPSGTDNQQSTHAINQQISNERYRIQP